MLYELCNYTSEVESKYKLMMMVIKFSPPYTATHSRLPILEQFPKLEPHVNKCLKLESTKCAICF